MTQMSTCLDVLNSTCYCCLFFHLFKSKNDLFSYICWPLPPNNYLEKMSSAKSTEQNEYFTFVTNIGWDEFWNKFLRQQITINRKKNVFFALQQKLMPNSLKRNKT